MGRIYSPPRYSTVSWLWHSDLEEGRPCTYERTFDHVHCSVWRVTLYDHEEEIGLQLTAQKGNGNDGGRIALAITSLTRQETPAMDMHLLSGPVRYDTDDQPRDDGA